MADFAANGGLFDRAAAAVSIEDLATAEGVTLRRAGREMRGACPLCGAGATSKSGPFAVKADGARWGCYACALFGDVVDLEQGLRGGTLGEAARRLAGNEPRAVAARPARAQAPAGPSLSDQVAREMWAAGRPIGGTLAERYLKARGIDGPVLEAAAGGAGLRFHPFAKYAWDEGRRDWTKHPALLAQVVTPAGPTGGVHATYLARHGQGKAAVRPAKRMWGAQLDGEGRPGGAWLIGPEGPGLDGSDLVVAEGLESALSVAVLAMRAGLAMRVAAALSLDRLQGGEMRDAEGRVDPFAPRPDVARPPFTWPAPAAQPWPVVRVAVDRDMSPMKVRGVTPRGRTTWFERDAELRARLCGRLAVAGWRRAGAACAQAVAPRPGSDFNDELRRVLARESAS